jgi:hypothetical protein
LEPWGNERFTTTWSSHGSNKHSIDNISEWMLRVFSVVPASLVNELSKDFDWWLSTIVLLLRHVQVVNKDNASHSKSRTKVIFPSLIKFVVNNVLDLVAVSLSGESHLNDQELFSWQLNVQDLLDVCSLACTCGSNEQCSDIVHNKHLEKESIPDRIHCCHDDFLNN